MGSLQFSLVAPEKILLDQPVSMVVIPGREGDIGVLPGHAPLLTLLRPGVVTVYEEEKVIVKIFVNGGFAEVTPEKCTALVTEGTPLAALDKRALEIEIKNLLEDMADSKTEKERKEAEQNLNVAQAKMLEILAAVK